MTLVNLRLANDNPDTSSLDRTMSPFVRQLSEEFRESLARETRSFKRWFTFMLVVQTAAILLLIKYLP